VILPPLSPGDFEGCDTADEAADRVIGLLDEAGGLPELAEMTENRFQAYLGFDLFDLTLQSVLERAAGLFKSRSEARTKGLPALRLAHDGETVIEISVSPEFVGRLLRHIANQRNDAEILEIVLEDQAFKESKANLNRSSFGWGLQNGDAGVTGDNEDRRRK
jgi:hypothetical protein